MGQQKLKIEFLLWLITRNIISTIGFVRQQIQQTFVYTLLCMHVYNPDIVPT